MTAIAVVAWFCVDASRSVGVRSSGSDERAGVATVCSPATEPPCLLGTKTGDVPGPLSCDLDHRVPSRSFH